jgi:hypothetical protein
MQCALDICRSSSCSASAICQRKCEAKSGDAHVLFTRAMTSSRSAMRTPSERMHCKLGQPAIWKAHQPVHCKINLWRPHVRRAHHHANKSKYGPANDMAQGR